MGNNCFVTVYMGEDDRGNFTKLFELILLISESNNGCPSCHPVHRYLRKTIMSLGSVMLRRNRST